MLGILHRTVLGKGPTHFRKHFSVLPGRKLVDPRASCKDSLVKRSILGLVAVYNILPWRIRDASSVRDFQRAAQDLVKAAADAGAEGWVNLLSPRASLEKHPLLNVV